MPKKFILAGFMAMAASTALSDSVAKLIANPDSIARSFIGHCLQNSGDYNRIVSFAEALNFDRIPQELDVLSAPQNPYDDFSQFKATDENGAVFLIGASRSKLDGIPMVACSFGFEDLDLDALVASLDRYIGLGRPQHEFTEMGQHYRIWEPVEEIVGSQIVLVDGAPMQMNVGSISLLSPEKR
jgi:hypothetical protein